MTVTTDGDILSVKWSTVILRAVSFFIIHYTWMSLLNSTHFLNWICVKSKLHLFTPRRVRVWFTQTGVPQFEWLLKPKDPWSLYWPESLYISTKSPATMEKSVFWGKFWGLTSGNLIGRVWSEDFLLLLNWWIQGYRVREFTCSHLNGVGQIYYNRLKDGSGVQWDQNWTECSYDCRHIFIALSVIYWRLYFPA